MIYEPEIWDTLAWGLGIVGLFVCVWGIRRK